MIDYIHKDLYWQDSIDKQLKIELEDGTILDNSMIYSEEFELEESICSEDELRFGACEASCVKFRIFSIPNRLVGQNITISEVLGGQTDSPMQIGKYKIASAKPTADRDFIDIVAYDVMYDIIHSDIAAWYNNQFKATTSTTTDEDGNETTVVTYSTNTLKKFRDSFFSHFGIEQVDITLPNDGMVVSKTIEIVPNEDGTIGETLSGSVVIEAICEINGCFGHINRDGKFEYVTLQPISKELFPADDLFPRNDLYPASDNVGLVIYNWQYEATEYEDFDVQPITQVQIIQEDNDIGMTVGNDGNKYVVNSNFLTYSLSDAELETVGTNLLSVIEKAKYTPIKANVIGNPCVTVGDIIKIVTNSAILYSYVINRTLKGCQSLTDEFESNGEEYRSVDVNSTSGQIKKLQGRSNVLERSIDETRMTITNVEKGLKNDIKVTAEGIEKNITKNTTELKTYADNAASTAESNANGNTAEQLKSYPTKTEMTNTVKETAEGIERKITKTTTELKTYADNAASTAESNANGNTAEQLKSYPTKTEMKTEISASAESITSIVSSTQSKWDVSYYEEKNWEIIYGTSEQPESDPTGDNKLYLDVVSGGMYASNYVSDISKYVWQFRGYAKKTEDVLQSSITQTASSIESTIAESQSKWDVSNFPIPHARIKNGYGAPTVAITGYSGYLDVSTGFEYYWGDDGTGTGNKNWAIVGKATEIKSDLETKITETASGITASVTEKLKNYSTTEEMESAISISKDNIESTVAKSTKEWDMKDPLSGEEIKPKWYTYTNSKYTYGKLDDGTYAYYMDFPNFNIMVGDVVFYQVFGIARKCSSIGYRNGKKVYLYDETIQTNKVTSELSTKIEQTNESITLEVNRATTKEEDLQSSIDMHADEIVLKVDANGKIVEVALTGDPKDGTEFTVDADNISLTASDIIDIIANNSINLTSKNITIDSTNFNVDEDGNMSCKNAQIEGDVVATSAIIYDSLAMKHSVYGSVDIENVLEVRYRTNSDPAEWCVYANIREFIGNIDVEGSLYCGNGLGVSGTVVFNNDATCQGITCQGIVVANAASVGGALTAGSISSNGACGFGSIWTGALTCAGDTVVPDWYANTTDSGSNCHIGSAGRIRRVASSSKRYKDDITTDIKEELDPHKLYDTTIYQYKYKEGYLSSENGKRKDRIGFIVEDLEKQYPIAVDYIKDEKGKKIPENWNDRYLIPPMLKLIQEQKQEIDTLKQQLATLTERMDRYEQGLQ